jgi:hypothetical protein
VREVAARDDSPRDALDALIELYVGWFVAHPGFLRMHLRAGTSWALTPPGTAAQVRHWEDIHALQADIFRRGVAAGVFVDEDPAYLARLFSRWTRCSWPSGSRRDEGERAELVSRLRRQAERSFCRTAVRRAMRSA